MSDDGTVRLTGAVRRYGADFQLGPVDLRLDAGEWVALEGRSGAGKTTLLHLASGLDRADEGEVVLFDTPLGELANGAIAALRRRWVGIVHQEPLFLEHLSVWENLSVRFVPSGMRAGERRSRAGEVLARLGLEHVLDRHPRDLSGGERQRLSVARAIVAEPALIVADEPTASVDDETGELVLAALRSQKERGASILTSSHDEATLAASDRRLRLVAGTLDS